MPVEPHGCKPGAMRVATHGPVPRLGWQVLQKQTVRRSSDRRFALPAPSPTVRLLSGLLKIETAAPNKRTFIV
jgi:hypothetical protein